MNESHMVTMLLRFRSCFSLLYRCKVNGKDEYLPYYSFDAASANRSSFSLNQKFDLYTETENVSEELDFP